MTTAIEELWTDAKRDEEHKRINGALLHKEAAHICGGCGVDLAHVPPAPNCKCPCCGYQTCDA